MAGQVTLCCHESVGLWLRRVGSLAVALLFLVGSVSGASAVTPARQQAEPVTLSPVDAQSAATATDAASIARTFGHRVEIASDDAEASTTYANPDGSQTSEQSAQPTRVRIAGNWVSVDPTLVEQPDGSYAPRATAVSVRIGGGGSSMLAAVGLGSGAATYSWTSILPAPAISGAAATYADVAPGIDLRVTVTDFTVETFLILKSRPAVALAPLALPVSLSGVSASADATGAVTYTDTSGAVVGTGSAPQMWDSSADRVSGSPRSAAVGSQLVGNGGVALPRQALPRGAGPVAATQTLDVPAGFLGDPGTTYPVTIDPEVVSGGGQSAYGYIDSAFGSQNGYDYTYQGLVRIGQDPDLSDGVNRAFWSFAAIPGLQTGRATVLSATFSVGLMWTASCSPQPVTMYNTGGFGNPTSWNAQPWLGSAWATISPPSANTTGCGGGHSISVQGFNATAMMASLVAWPGYYIQLRAQNEASTAQWQKFNPGATLSVTYVNTPNAATSVAFSSPSAPCTTTAPYPIVNSNYALSVGGIYSTPDGGTVRAGYGIISTGGGPVVWSANTIANSGQAQGASTPAPIPGVVQGGTYDLQTYGWQDTSSWGNFIGPVTHCYFTVDNSVPAVPVLTTPVNGDGTVNVSPSPTVGKPSTLTLASPTSANVVGVRYQWGSSSFALAGTAQATTRVGSFATPAGSAVYQAVSGASTLVVAPVSAGISSLYVEYVNSAGTASAPLQVTFNAGYDFTGGKVIPPVNAAQWPSHAWPVSAGSGSSVSDSGNVTASPAGSPGSASPMSLATGLSSATPANNPSGTSYAKPTGAALAFAGPYTGSYNNSTSIATVATGANLTVPYSTGFTIGAWVYPTTTGDQWHHEVMSQEGTNNSGFYLRTSWTPGVTAPSAWEFCFTTDPSVATFAISCVDSSTSVVLNQWTFIAAAWDPVNQQIRLFVYSPNSASTPVANTFTAPAATPTAATTGPIVVGRAQWDGAGDYDAFAGQIAAPFLTTGVMDVLQLSNQYKRTSA